MDKDMDILFLGGMFPKEKEDDILKNSIGSIQNAANNLQWELILGLDANLEKPIKILTSLYIGSFPKRYKKLLINSYSFSHTPGANNDINVGFFNLAGVKNYSRYLSLKPYLRRWALEKSQGQKVIIAYAMTITFVELFYYIKKIDKNIATCLIVPDLPQYMNLTYKKSLLYKVLKNIEIKQITKKMDSIDSYVLLTKYMASALRITNVPNIIIEGISTNIFEKVDAKSSENGLKMVMYSGGLEKKYGIFELINAFKRLPNENYRLIICGSGSIEKEIVNLVKSDSRISFKGQLPRKEVLELQMISTILVNPRPNNEEFTKYSFPSKIMEYLSSGTPVVAYKLDGIPDEYYKYIYTIEESQESLFQTLKNILAKSKVELEKKGEIARDYVLKEKNNIIQAKKIIEMIKTL